MKQITIVIEHDSDLDSEEKHNFECITTMNGPYYHNCLQAVHDILLSYKVNKTDTPAKVLDDIRRKSFKHFRGLFHDQIGEQ